MLLPSKSAAKTAKKLREYERREAKRLKRVAAMSPEERARYERHQATHQPGSSGRRKAMRDSANRRRDARSLFDRLEPASPHSEELALLNDRLVDLNLQLRAMIDAQLADVGERLAALGNDVFA